MNKAQLVESMSRHMGSTKADAERALEAFTGAVAAGLKREGEVAIQGFGTFRKTHRAARTVRNPQTGAPIDVAASVGVGFRAGKSLRDAL